MSEQEKSHSQNAYSEQARQVADLFIEAISKPDSPMYMSPWVSDGPQLGGQFNPATGKAYSGANQFALYLTSLKRGVADDRWLTFKQVGDLGLRVKKGAKSERVFFYDKKEAVPEPGESKEDAQARDKWVIKYYRVFNGSDVEGLEPMQKTQPRTIEQKNEACEKVIADAGIPINHVQGNRAYYSASKDEITVPLREQFLSDELYYSTVLHELGHSTGHHSRLNRDLRGKFGSPEYAKEELRAEIGSMMMSQRLGIQHDLGQHVAYVKSWVKLLQEHPTEIMKACADAEKICHHLGVHALTHERAQAKEQVLTNEAKQQADKSFEKLHTQSQEDAKAKAKEKTVERNKTREAIKKRAKAKEQVQAKPQVRKRQKTQSLSM